MAVLTATAVAGSGVAAQASQTPAPLSPGDRRPASRRAGRRDAPVLLDAQFRRILEQVASAVDAGDAAKDATKLQPRVAGPELEVRTQNYKIRSQVGSYEARMPVRATKLLTTVVTEQAQLAAHGHGRHPGRGQRCSAAAHPDPGLPAGELQAGPHHAAAAGDHLPGDRARRHARRWRPTDKTGPPLQRRGSAGRAGRPAELRRIPPSRTSSPRASPPRTSRTPWPTRPMW